MSNRYPVRGTPTMIRHYSEFAEYRGHPIQIVAVVTSVSTCEAFTAFFHVHRIFANGQGTLTESGGEWSHEKGATDQWEQWVANHCTVPHGTPKSPTTAPKPVDSLTAALDEIAKDLASWVTPEGKEDALAHASDLLAEQLDAAFDRAQDK